MSSTDSTPTPALPPPPGVTSNFDHPASLKRLNNIAIGVAIPILTIVFGLRVYTRIWIRRSWIFEDWLVSVAYIGTISFCGTAAATMDHYAGRHEWDITAAEAREASYRTLQHYYRLYYPLSACPGGLGHENESPEEDNRRAGVYFCAPAFSLVGVLVRARGSNNPDKTWVQPEIIQWGLAELTTAVLCACFPELGPLWKRQRTRAGPTASISNGQYRLTDASSRKKTSRGLSTTTTLCTAGRLEHAPYIELTDNPSYSVQAAAHNTDASTSSLQGHRRQITVTQEVRVDSASKV
ncbi:hypothetical protein O1611_g7393 [Lasiodiplodia mahajangana]|uniref:Uncharacterized protein n=1 Tax=Lasiodiplodia mahajangana TaxID=1108764 RepID=A0ACC2JFI2_9PEZI|nr:hypothetical protein O1611_g7393 [Lasiodiplodia mahajangana]